MVHMASKAQLCHCTHNHCVHCTPWPALDEHIILGSRPSSGPDLWRSDAALLPSCRWQECDHLRQPETISFVVLTVVVSTARPLSSCVAMTRLIRPERMKYMWLLGDPCCTICWPAGHGGIGCWLCSAAQSAGLQDRTMPCCTTCMCGHLICQEKCKTCHCQGSSATTYSPAALTGTECWASPTAQTYCLQSASGRWHQLGHAIIKLYTMWYR